jgi:hypothetical protein
MLRAWFALADATGVNPTSAIDIIQSTGIIGILVIILFTGIKRMWVFGWQYNELKERYAKLVEEKDGWKDLAMRSANLAESIQELARGKGVP